MEYVKLGNTGLKVSNLCLGTMTMGSMNDEKEAFRILDAALDSGITFFDTSNHYGGGVGHRGRVETIMGKWFAQNPGKREKVVLNTKSYYTMEDESDGPNDAFGMSAYKIYRSFERSLKRLNTDHVEMYMLHHAVDDANWDELWGAYENLVNQGKTYYVASSNHGARHIVKAYYEAKKRNFLGFVAEEHKYNLFCRLPELEVIPACNDLGIAFMAYAPLAGGYLGENALNPKPHTRSAGGTIYTPSMGDYSVGPYREQLIAFDKLCKELGAVQSDVAQAWILNNPAVTISIIGPRTEEQLMKSVQASEMKLDEDTKKRLDEIFPGPGGAAPEAYSW